MIEELYNGLWNGTELPEGHLIEQDHECISKYSHGVCVNLGTFKGRSSALMSLTADKVITIDCYIEPSFGHKEVVENLKGFKNVIAYEGKTWDMANLCNDNSVDMIFQDADHSVSGILKDFDSWYPKLKMGGYMLFHDWLHQNGREKCMDVRGGVTEILKNKSIKDIGLTGWTYVTQRIY